MPDFEEIEKALAEMKWEASDFGRGKDNVSAAVEILRGKRKRMLACRQKLLPALMVFLFVCNLAQSFLLLESRKKSLHARLEKATDEFVITARGKSVKEVLDATVSDKTFTEVITVSTGQTAETTAEENLKALLELYTLFENVSPSVILEARDHNNSPIEGLSLKPGTAGGDCYGKT